MRNGSIALAALAAVFLSACASSPRPGAVVQAGSDGQVRYYGDRGGAAPAVAARVHEARGTTPQLGFRFTEDEARLFSGPSVTSGSVGTERAGAAYRVSDGKGSALQLCLGNGRRAWARASSGSMFSGNVDGLPECR